MQNGIARVRPSRASATQQAALRKTAAMERDRRKWRRVAAAVLSATTAVSMAIGMAAGLALGACARSDRGAQRDAFGRVLPVPASPPTTAPKPYVRGDKSYDTLIRNTLADLQSYWTKEFPDVYGDRYDPLRLFYAYAAKTRMPVCDNQQLPYLLIQNNAFYCRENDFIAWDDGQLFPDLQRDYGKFALALVLAHEWGHAIQQRAGTDEETVIMEQQADCFAGAWTAHVDATPASRARLAFVKSDLDVALAGLVRFRDLIGMTAATFGAHGTGFDRVRAFQEGFSKGPGECARYTEDPPQLVGIPFKTLQNRLFGGDAPFSKVVPRVTASLNAYWNSALAVRATAVGAKAKPPVCAGPIMTVVGVSKHDVSYCRSTNTVSYDEATIRSLYDEFGDFAVATLLSELWANAQLAAGNRGVAPSPERALCHTGLWSDRVFLDTENTSSGSGIDTGIDTTIAAHTSTTVAPTDRLTLSPGDLDEAVQWLLRSSRTSSSAGPAKAFGLVDAFRIGFRGDPASCASL